MSAGTTVAPLLPMLSLRLAAYGLCAIALVLCASGCAKSSDDGSVTNDANEINEGRGALERDLTPPLDLPSDKFISGEIGAKMTDVLATLKGTAVAGQPVTATDCTVVTYTDSKSNKAIVEDVQCKSSAIVRELNADGTTKAEHTDLNKDGKVDRWSGATETYVQLTDTNFDGKVDVITEDVNLITDFSTAGYGEDFPASSFLYRLREDRDRDGKLDHEKLLARGALPAATTSQ